MGFGLFAAATQAAPIAVILDTDIGDDIDDTWALAMLLGMPQLDLKLVVTDYGNTPERTRLVAKILQRAGRTDIPIGTGVKTLTESPRAKRFAQPERVREVLNGKRHEARVSWWGFDPADSTAHLQEAIDSRVKRLILDRKGHGLQAITGEIILERQGRRETIAIDDAWLETMRE